MILNVRIKNFGKLKNEEVCINNFTVFAGPNNSGKSFVSKILYSIIKAMRANHAQTYLSHILSRFDMDIEYVMWEEENLFIDSHGMKLIGEIQDLRSKINNCPYRNINELTKFINNIGNRIDKILQLVKKFNVSEESRILNHWASILAELRRNLEKHEVSDIISLGMEIDLNKKLKDNFQAARISRLANDESLPIEISIDKIGIFRFLNGDTRSDLHKSWRQHVLPFSRLIYMESPIYWKLKTALEEIQLVHSTPWSERKPIVGIPQYFYDLASALRYEYTGEIAFPDLHKKLTSESILGGKLAISEDGRLSFQENGRNFSLMQTATGIANVGFLALLIERKLLDNNSFIFIDEPEAHLHPAWQVIMADTLFELAENGVHVVIATHSIDILKWLEVHANKDPARKELISLNQFPTTGGIVNDNFDDEISAIKQELIKPFSDLYLEGL